MGNILSEFAEYIYGRINRTFDEFEADELDWKPVEESNSVYWVLVHATRTAYLLIPQVLDGTYNPMGWDDDYAEKKHNLEELRSDLADGRKNVVSKISMMDDTKFSEEILIWGSKRPLKEVVFALLGELMHHNGQLAMLRGIYKRSKSH